MLKRQFKLISLIFFFYLISSFPSNGEIVKKIEILGNERISNETIIVFAKTNVNDDLKVNDINLILKALYDSNFFDDVSVAYAGRKTKIQY